MKTKRFFLQNTKIIKCIVGDELYNNNSLSMSCSRDNTIYVYHSFDDKKTKKGGRWYSVQHQPCEIFFDDNTHTMVFPDIPYDREKHKTIQFTLRPDIYINIKSYVVDKQTKK